MMFFGYVIRLQFFITFISTNYFFDRSIILQIAVILSELSYYNGFSALSLLKNCSTGCNGLISAKIIREFFALDSD